MAAIALGEYQEADNHVSVSRDIVARSNAYEVATAKFLGVDNLFVTVFKHTVGLFRRETQQRFNGRASAERRPGLTPVETRP